jgi:hydrophobic/amphiphilic exporter-1 (mainly G- bacteria), HAE1 family
MALAIFLVYLVMASQFESFLHPFVIIFTLPLAAIGVVIALAATGRSVSIVAMIGVVMLAGIVVNNAIVLIDGVNQLRQKGMRKDDALVEAGMNRMRPILMTSLTTILGLIPMALGLGEGAELRAPLAITVIGGLTFATLLTLIVIPVVYSLFDRKIYEADRQSVENEDSFGSNVTPGVAETPAR